MFHMPYVMYILNVTKIPSTSNGIKKNRGVSVLICSTTWNTLKNRTWSQQTRKHIYRNIVFRTVFRGNDPDKLLMTAISLRNKQGRVHAYWWSTTFESTFQQQMFHMPYVMHILNVTKIPSTLNGIKKNKDISDLIRSTTWNVLKKTFTKTHFQNIVSLIKCFTVCVRMQKLLCISQLKPRTLDPRDIAGNLTFCEC